MKVSITPQLLYVDAYDSFAQNIVALLRNAIEADVAVVSMDDPEIMDLPREAFGKHFRDRFDAVVVGPGPGNPTNPNDVGFIPRLWELEGKETLPILGICLGFQSLCFAFGAQIVRLKEPKHGIVSGIKTKMNSICNSNPSLARTLRVTHYHSLHVQIGYFNRDRLWDSTERCPDLRPLAWDLEDADNGTVLEAVSHRRRPFWGVQFHPESICTEGGEDIIKNWWKAALEWRTSLGRPIVEREKTPSDHSSPASPTSTSAFSSRAAARHHVNSFRIACDSQVFSLSIAAGDITVDELCNFLHVATSEVVLLESGVTPNHSLLYPHTGRYSILGIVNNETQKLSYSLDSQLLTIWRGQSSVDVCQTVSDIWSYLEEFMTQIRATGGHEDIPFWGGLIGYVAYETGLRTTLKMRHPIVQSHRSRPDLCFALVQRSVVVDHASRMIYVQSIKANDISWVYDVARKLSLHSSRAYEARYSQIWWPSHPNFTMMGLHASKGARVRLEEGIIRQYHTIPPLVQHIKYRPYAASYQQKVRDCDERIRAGDSYELCLTDSIQVCVPSADMKCGYPWLLYRRLMRQNSAPFAAYIRMKMPDNEVHIIGSSPERFLKWDRKGLSEFRPIKGTVRKGPDMSPEKAREILAKPKEVAENLMIVDLIRHDLNIVKGVTNARVPQLFGVEEYMTVFQLVSVIQGQLPISRSLTFQQRRRSSADLPTAEGSRKEGLLSKLKGRSIKKKTNQEAIVDPQRRASAPAPSTTNLPSVCGIPVLRSSLPPGSMTGAPKLRSCEILRDLEKKPRGIYSGVIGYLDVGGGGDWSVVIRTAYRWTDDQDQSRGVDVWTVGAGGAVTAKSSPQEEYEEMVVKANCVLRAFDAEIV